MSPHPQWSFGKSGILRCIGQIAFSLSGLAMSRTLTIDWRAEDTEEELTCLFRNEEDVRLRTRLHALRQLRRGDSISKVASDFAVSYRTVSRWVSWYRKGGLREVLSHKQGGGGKKCFLDEEQQTTLQEEVAKGLFRTASEIRNWIAERFAIIYKHKSVYDLLRRLGCSPKVPRPRHEKADIEAQKLWKIIGLRDALIECGLTSSDNFGFSDEARIGLHGSPRRVWARHGIRVIQPVQIRRQWAYLFLVVGPVSGELYWDWMSKMTTEETVEALLRHRERSSINTLVWDGAGSHRSKDVRSIEGITSIVQPPYSPELNPVERVFEEVRRWTDGKIYESIEEKITAVDAFLHELASDPKRVRSLCGWKWITDAVRQALSDGLHSPKVLTVVAQFNHASPRS